MLFGNAACAYLTCQSLMKLALQASCACGGHSVCPATVALLKRCMTHQICLQVDHPGVSIVLDRNTWPYTVTLAGRSASSMRSAIAAARSAAYEAGSSAAAVAWPSTVFALSTREKLLLDNIDGGRLLADLETLHRVTIMVR